MGLGGNLMWIPIFRELVKGMKQHGLKVLPIELGRVSTSPVFINCPYITFNPNYKPSIVVDISYNLPHNYVIKQIGDRDQYIEDMHIVQHRAKYFKLNLNLDISGELFFTKDEKIKIDKCLQAIYYKIYGNMEMLAEALVTDKIRELVIIEPNSKNNYTLNKQYPLDKWQKITDLLLANPRFQKKYILIQISKSGLWKLDGLEIDLQELGGGFSLNYREAALLIKFSKLFVGMEGGLVHAASAYGVDTQALSIVPPIFSEKIVNYPNNINIWLGTETHQNCGMRSICPECQKIYREHDHTEIYRQIIDCLF